MISSVNAPQHEPGGYHDHGFFKQAFQYMPKSVHAQHEVAKAALQAPRSKQIEEANRRKAEAEGRIQTVRGE